MNGANSPAGHKPLILLRFETIAYILLTSMDASAARAKGFKLTARCNVTVPDSSTNGTNATNGTNSTNGTNAPTIVPLGRRGIELHFPADGVYDVAEEFGAELVTN